MGRFRTGKQVRRDLRNIQILMTILLIAACAGAVAATGWIYLYFGPGYYESNGRYVPGKGVYPTMDSPRGPRRWRGGFRRR